MSVESSMPGGWIDSPEPTETVPSSTASPSPPPHSNLSPDTRPLYLTHDTGEWLDLGLSAIRSSISLPYRTRRALQTAQDSLKSYKAAIIPQSGTDAAFLLEAITPGVESNLQSILQAGAELTQTSRFGENVNMDSFAGGMKLIALLKEPASKAGDLDELDMTRKHLLDQDSLIELPSVITSPSDAACWAYDTAAPVLLSCKSGALWARDTAWDWGTKAYTAIRDGFKTGASYISNGVSEACEWMWPEQTETTAPGLRNMAEKAFSPPESKQSNSTAGSQRIWVSPGEARTRPVSWLRSTGQSLGSSMGLNRLPAYTNVLW